MIDNPFDRPRSIDAWGPTSAQSAQTQPQVWASPPAPKIDTLPPNTAIDKYTGEILMQDDGKTPWDKDALLLCWQSSQKLLEEAKANEMRLRKMVVAAFTNPAVESGTERIELGNGYELKTVKAVAYKVGSKDENTSNVAAVKYALDRIAAYVGEGVEVGMGKVIAERLVKTQFALSVTEYKALPKPLKDIIDTVVTTTDGAPKVEIVAPKPEAE